MSIEESKQKLFELQLVLLKSKDDKSMEIYNAINTAIDSMATLEVIREDIERGKNYFQYMENDERITATFNFVIDLINKRMGDL